MAFETGDAEAIDKRENGRSENRQEDRHPDPGLEMNDAEKSQIAAQTEKDGYAEIEQTGEAEYDVKTEAKETEYDRFGE
jgi:hypothetical protein